MTATKRYWLFQIPGLVVSALVGFLLWQQGYISPLTAVYIFLAWVLKDIALYPLTVHSFRPNLDPTAMASMIGKVGEVKHPLRPEGMVWIRGERWQAVSDDGSVLPIGTEVEVVSGEGLTLRVKPVEHEAKNDESKD